MINAGGDCGSLAIVAPEDDNLDMAAVLLSKLLQHGKTAIYAAIVHKDDLPGVFGGIKYFMDGLVQKHQVVFFVIDGNDQG